MVRAAAMLRARIIPPPVMQGVGDAACGRCAGRHELRVLARTPKSARFAEEAVGAKPHAGPSATDVMAITHFSNARMSMN
jgi:hypothetical protein